MVDEKRSRPFHESVILMIEDAETAGEMCLVEKHIMRMTVLNGHDEIEAAWRKAHTEAWPEMSLGDDDELLTHLRQQKARAEIQATQEMAGTWSMGRLRYFLRRLDVLLDRLETEDQSEIRRLLAELGSLASIAAKAIVLDDDNEDDDCTTVARPARVEGEPDLVTAAEGSDSDPDDRPVFLDELEEGIDPDGPNNDQALALSSTQVHDLLRSPSGDGDPDIGRAIPHGLTIEVFPADQLPSRLRPGLPSDHGCSFADPLMAGGDGGFDGPPLDGGSVEDGEVFDDRTVLIDMSRPDPFDFDKEFPSQSTDGPTGPGDDDPTTRRKV